MLLIGSKHPTIDYSKKRMVRLKRYKLKWNCVSGYVFFVYQVSTFSSNKGRRLHGLQARTSNDHRSSN